MPFTNGKASPPLSNEDLARYFGHADGDLGSLITYALTNKLINPFSLSKPVRDSAVGLVNRGYSLASLGFGTPPSAASVQGLLDLYADGDSNTLYQNVRANGWRYLGPRGVGNGITEYFRIADFFKVLNNAIVSSSGEYGYDEDAVNPFGSFTLSPSSISTFGGQLTARNQRPLPSGPVDEHYLTISDFHEFLDETGLDMIYYGVLFIPINSSGNWDTTYAAHIIANNTDTIYDNSPQRGHEEMSITENIYTAFRVGDYRGYPFLATGVLSSSSTFFSVSYDNRYNTFQDNIRLYPLPGTVPTVLTVFGAPIRITVHTGTVRQDVQTGEYIVTGVYYTVENLSSSSVTFDTFYLRFRFSPHTYSDRRATGETDYSKNTLWNDYYDGVTDTKYALLLQERTLAAGATVTSNTQDVTLPSSTSDRFYIGCSYNGNDASSGAVVVRLPSGQ